MRTEYDSVDAQFILCSSVDRVVFNEVTFKYPNCGNVMMLKVEKEAVDVVPRENLTMSKESTFKVPWSTFSCYALQYVNH